MRLSVLAAALAFTASVHAQTPVRIGSASPLSGPSAHQGKDIENGARLAIDDLNAQGATIGGKKVKWVLQAEDDGSDPKLGTAVAQKLVDGGVVAVVGHLNSGTTVPASKIYNSAGIPQISPAATTPLYTHQGYKTAFRVVANDDLVGRVLASYAIGTLKAKKIAIIDDRTAFGQGLADQFAKDVKRTGGAEIVSRQFTNDRATDFNAILTQIRARRPDVIFYGGMDATAGPMLKQMQALGIKATFVSGDGVCSEKLPQLAGAALGDDRACAWWPAASTHRWRRAWRPSASATASATAWRSRPMRRTRTTRRWRSPPPCAPPGRPTRRSSCRRSRSSNTRASRAPSRSTPTATCATPRSRCTRTARAG